MVLTLASGHTYRHFDEEEQKDYHKDFPGPLNEMIILSPGEFVVPKIYLRFQDKVFNFKFKSDDVVIMTYSKCGTTWMQEMIWTMRNNPNLDNPQANLPLFARSPFLESDMIFSAAETDRKSEMFQGLIMKFNELCPGKNIDEGMQIQMLEALPGKRTIKTHFPFSLLPPNLLSTCKVIFVVRNPKDVVLSFQHHHRLIKAHGFTGEQDTFVDYFVNDRLLYGSYAKMVLEGWSQRNHPNMHFVSYEDLKADIEGELVKLDKFIGTRLTEEQLKNVKEYTSFNSMKSRDPMRTTDSSTTNGEIAKRDGTFFRKGEAGTWKGKLTEEQNKKIDDYISRTFHGSGLSFKF